MTEYYSVLGLQRGATEEEIHAAFQRMSEQYHPDKDASLDAEMKLYEARAAYFALLRMHGIQAVDVAKKDTAVKTDDAYYLALGLKRGATQEEMDSAYLRLMDLYHPDKDASPDAKTKYHDACVAYYALCALQKANGVQTDATPKNVVYDNYHDRLSYARIDDSKVDDCKYLLDFPIRDYFFRLKLIVVVVGSFAAFFIATRYLSIVPHPRIPLTDEAAARFLWHTMAFVSACWLIFWFVRFYGSHPLRAMPRFIAPYQLARTRPFLDVMTWIMSGVYTSMIYLVTLRQEIFLISGPDHFYRLRFVFIGHALYFYIIFYCAACFLEKEGITGELKRLREGLRVMLAILRAKLNV